MLSAIRDFFDQRLSQPGAAVRKKEHTLELATATLLAEVVRLDGEIAPAERNAVLRAVRAHFHLSDAEAATLFRLAEEEARGATDYYQFTSLIRQRYSQEQRQQIVELMWHAAYADAVLGAHEQHLIRKIADLLYVSHSAYIGAKMRAKEAAEGR